MAEGGVAQGGPADFAAVIDLVRKTLAEHALERGLCAELVSLPTEALVGEGMEQVDPAAIHAARGALRAELGRALEHEWRSAQTVSTDDSDTGGARRLRSVALVETASA